MSNDLYYLGEFEQLVLLAVLRLGDEAYGMRVRRELHDRAKRETAIGAVYATLDRLEDKQLLRSSERSGDDARGGRPRRVFALTAGGRRALARVRNTVARMSDGLDLRAPGEGLMRALDRFALGALAAVTPRADRDALLGDLLEDHAARGGLARECVRALLPVLTMRVRRAGGVRALGFACLAGGLAGALPSLLLSALWHFVLFMVPLRAAGALPLAWRLVGLVPALVAGVCTGRMAFRLAVQLLGGRS